MTQSFTPSPDNTRAYRDALGSFATGVAIVTVAGADGPLGMTVNSFASVSLTPPLVLWSLERNSVRYPGFAAISHYAVHVLRADQKALALGFARRGDGFDDLAWSANAAGVPVLHDCLSSFECRLHQRLDGGDHDILLGQVERATTHTGSPLIFAQGKFAAPGPGA